MPMTTPSPNNPLARWDSLSVGKRWATVVGVIVIGVILLIVGNAIAGNHGSGSSSPSSPSNAACASYQSWLRTPGDTSELDSAHNDAERAITASQAGGYSINTWAVQLGGDLTQLQNDVENYPTTNSQLQIAEQNVQSDCSHI